jgi:hypothetical protein
MEVSCHSKLWMDAQSPILREVGMFIRSSWLLSPSHIHSDLLLPFDGDAKRLAESLLILERNREHVEMVNGKSLQDKLCTSVALEFAQEFSYARRLSLNIRNVFVFDDCRPNVKAFGVLLA